jgi:amino acid transporter
VSPRGREGLGLLPLVAILFFNVSGGPYGLEDAVSSLGPGLALLLLVVTPVVWSIPVALAMGELATALPEEGGYVVWVQRAFGPFWGFQAGWWSWINSFVDVAVYPALFADYLAFWRPQMSSLERFMLALAFIWLLTAVNLAGVRITGWSAVWMGVVSVAPVVVLTLASATRLHEVPWRPFAASESSWVASLGLGLAVMMWNYSGWDTPTTVLGETRAPGASFRRAMWVTLPLITLAYVLPVVTGLSAAGDWETWDTGHWPVLALAVGGPWLGHLVTVGAVVATGGLFLSLLLTNSRLPYALALLGQMPAVLGRVHPSYGTPWPAVLLSSACYSLCAFWSFKDLIVLNIWLYSIALLLELAAFVALRLREPSLPRPWRVRGGAAGMWLVAGLPALCCLLAMATAGWMNTLVGVLAALTGPGAYLLWRSPVAAVTPAPAPGSGEPPR